MFKMLSLRNIYQRLFGPYAGYCPFNSAILLAKSYSFKS
ncbi:hypothetical protein ADICYQ_4792 [Cyclobacterium qasimii M12-11B]|uniref:Uncharacterized protein n=1 Tax=Cyclobacterium qasimii M12-11B TaxID=641524 RepID=S7WH67_9BACT|nr:hypothetical protein ADICYQ_4792 [Cyclobacterium qasimii M12-11B]